MTTRPIRSPAAEWMGMELVEAVGGVARVTVTPREEMANSAGFVHGGILATLADSAMGRAVWSDLREQGKSLSFDLKVTFIQAAKVGELLTATGKVIHPGRRTVIAECEIRGRGERLIATASGSFLVQRKVAD